MTDLNLRLLIDNVRNMDYLPGKGFRFNDPALEHRVQFMVKMLNEAGVPCTLRQAAPVFILTVVTGKQITEALYTSLRYIDFPGLSKAEAIKAIEGLLSPQERQGANKNTL